MILEIQWILFFHNSYLYILLRHKIQNWKSSKLNTILNILILIFYFLFKLIGKYFLGFFLCLILKLVNFYCYLLKSEITIINENLKSEIKPWIEYISFFDITVTQNFTFFYFLFRNHDDCYDYECKYFRNC